jgi:hypothetical protein
LGMPTPSSLIACQFARFPRAHGKQILYTVGRHDSTERQ